MKLQTSIVPLNLFEKLGELYVARLMRSVWEENADCEKDPWLSLRVFLKMYAFERQGRAPDYAFAAVDAIDEHRFVSMKSTSARMVWESFASRLGNRNLNHANNPLCPQGTGFKRFNKKVKARRDSTVKNISAVQLAGELDVPLITWAKDRLQRGEVGVAHKRLCEINGIGDKIASFFLRDVASHFQIAPAQDRHLLQPVDVWIRFVTHTLCRNKSFTDKECALWIVAESKTPENANQGIWYFCSEVGHSSQYLVSRALRDITFFNKLVRKHLDELRRFGTIAVEFDKLRDAAENTPSHH